MRPLYAGLFVRSCRNADLYAIIYHVTDAATVGIYGCPGAPSSKKTTKNGIRMGFGYSRLLMVFFLVLGIRWYSFTANDAVSMHK